MTSSNQPPLACATELHGVMMDSSCASLNKESKKIFSFLRSSEQSVKISPFLGVGGGLQEQYILFGFIK